MAPLIEKRIVDAATLANSVESLSVGLKSFGDNARHMENICNSFQSRLGQLEYEMRPMKMMSQKLTVARKNVTEAVGEMEKVNEYFTLEAKTRDNIARGVRGAGPTRLAEYADDVRRILKAIEFFRALPSLRSQSAALAGLSALCSTAATEFLDEYNRIMRAVGPSVQFSSEAQAYEPVAPLSESALAGLVTAQSALELLNKRSALRQTYASARRITVAATLRSWSDRYEVFLSAARANTADLRPSKLSGAEKLTSFLDFAVKLVAGERLLWEQALGVNPSKQRDHSAEEAFLTVVTSVINKLLKDVDTGVQETLHELRVAQGEASKNKDKSEKNKGPSAIEGDRRVEGMVLLLEMGDTLNRGAALLLRVLRMGGGKDDNQLTISLAGVQSRLCQAALNSCVELAEAVRSDPSGKKNVPVNAAVHVLASNTLRAVKRITPFREGYETLAKASTERMPWEFYQSSAITSKKDTSGVNAVDAEHCPEAQRCKRFTLFINHIIMQLMGNLIEKSQAYPAGRAGDALRQLFLLNNANYLLTNSRTTNALPSMHDTGINSHSVMASLSARAEAIVTIFRPLSPRSSPRRGGPDLTKGESQSGDITPRTERRNSAVDIFFSGSGSQKVEDSGTVLCVAHFLTADTHQQLEKLFVDKEQLQASAYCSTLFDPIVVVLEDDVGQLEYGSRGKLLSLECGRLIKNKFSTFNEAWEELSNSQQNVSVGDQSIRHLLTDEARRRVLQPYTKLYNAYKDVQFSKKHQQEYLKYTPEAVMKAIDDLFMG